MTTIEEHSSCATLINVFTVETGAGAHTGRAIANCNR
jgi:hypothetical protein